MSGINMSDRARDPSDLSRYFVSRVNAGDLDGLVRLYEPNAIRACGEGKVAIGSLAIRAFYQGLLATRPQFTPGHQAPPLINGDLALTSTRLTNGTVTAEVARRQPDGSWLWIIDQPVID